MGKIKRAGAEITEEVRSAAGGFLLETIGGKGEGPKFVMTPEKREAFEADRQKLGQATGREHFFSDGDVSGRLMGKVELGGNELARIDCGKEGIALTPWQDDMSPFLGKDVSISRDQGQTITRELNNSIERER